MTDNKIIYYVFIVQKNQNDLYHSKILLVAFSNKTKKVQKEKIIQNIDKDKFHTISFLENIFKNIKDVNIVLKNKSFYQELTKKYPQYIFKYIQDHKNFKKIHIDLDENLKLPASLLHIENVDLKNNKSMYQSHIKNLITFLKAGIYFQDNLDKMQDIPVFKYYQEMGFISKEQTFEDFLVEVTNAFSQLKDI